MTRGSSIPLAACLLAIAGCVTVRPDEGGGGGSPVRNALGGGTPTNSGARDPAAPVELPKGPIASPAKTLGGTTVHLRLMIRPLGSVPYDGQVLPLVSPDGRFLATQTGLAPSWETLLAAPNATSPQGVRPVVYDLANQPMAEVAPAEAPPMGVILGRSADTSGFLVEWPRPDGSRWIGKMSWVGQQISWLARDNDVHAHATLTRDGAVIWSHRPFGAQRYELMIKGKSGQTAVFSDPNLSFMFPTMGDDPSLVFAFALSEKGGMDWVAIRIAATDGQAAFGSVVSRRLVSNLADAALAFQMIASAQTPPVAPATPPVGLAFYNPSLGRMVEWDTRSGQLSVLPERSVAAVRIPGLAQNGYFVTTEKGLVFSADPDPRLSPEGSLRPRPLPAPLFDLPNIARATLVADRPLIMVGPIRDSSEPRLAVIAASPAPDEPATPPK